MKKKIKLEAWKHETYDNIHFFTEENRPTNGFYKHLSEYDIEKEIEVMDKVKKPREFWVTDEDSIQSFDSGFIKIKAWTRPIDDGSQNGQIHFREVIPGSVQITRNDLALVWNATTYLPKPANGKEMFSQFCRALGLVDE